MKVTAFRLREAEAHLQMNPEVPDDTLTQNCHKIYLRHGACEGIAELVLGTMWAAFSRGARVVLSIR